MVQSKWSFEYVYEYGPRSLSRSLWKFLYRKKPTSFEECSLSVGNRHNTWFNIESADSDSQ